MNSLETIAQELATELTQELTHLNLKCRHNIEISPPRPSHPSRMIDVYATGTKPFATIILDSTIQIWTNRQCIGTIDYCNPNFIQEIINLLTRLINHPAATQKTSSKD